MRIDLHTHSTASDGLLTPDALVELAKTAGVGVLAVCDHDSTDGVDAAIAAGRRLGVEVIPAVEINTDVEASEVHVLGYYIDHHQAWFEDFLKRLRDGRLHRAENMVRKLNAIGVNLDFARVQALAHGAVGRPHVARALVDAGFVHSTDEAFEKYIGRMGPAYVERLKLTPQEAIQIIVKARGIPVLAHPGWGMQDAMIPALVQAGLEGVEVYYPDHLPQEVAHWAAIAAQYGLLVTGGTDFHGGTLATRAAVGSQYVPPEVVDRLKARSASKQTSQTQ